MTTIFRHWTAALLGPACLLSGAADAQEVPEPAPLTVSGTATLVSDYRFRGVSQSGGGPAVQGGITATHESGAYLSAWGSSIDFAPLGAAPVYGSMELDLAAGWSRDIASGVTADLGLAWYAYPGGHVGRANFFEGFGSLATTYGPARLKLGATYAWAQGALAGADNVHVYAGVDAALPGTPLTLIGRLGYQDGPLSAAWTGSGGARRSGWDWSAGAEVTVLGRLTLGASYVGASGRSRPGVTDDTLVATLTASF